MKVKELIDQLNDIDPTEEVYVETVSRTRTVCRPVIRVYSSTIQAYSSTITADKGITFIVCFKKR